MLSLWGATRRHSRRRPRPAEYVFRQSITKDVQPHPTSYDSGTRPLQPIFPPGRGIFCSHFFAVHARLSKWECTLVGFRRRQKQGRNIPLANAVLKEFKHKIRGVHLPPNVVAKAFDAERVHEVIWKIIRGLHFHHSGEISKANKSSSIVMVRLWLSFFGPLRARECATV